MGAARTCARGSARGEGVPPVIRNLLFTGARERKLYTHTHKRESLTGCLLLISRGGAYTACGALRYAVQRAGGCGWTRSPRSVGVAHWCMGRRRGGDLQLPYRASVPRAPRFCTGQNWRRPRAMHEPSSSHISRLCTLCTHICTCLRPSHHHHQSIKYIMTGGHKQTIWLQIAVA